MKIFVDENIPLMTVQALRAKGHDVLDIRRTPDEGMDDKTLWKTIQRDERLLITTDKGFAQHRNSTHCGILIIRLRQPNRQKIHQRIMNAITQFKAEKWSGLLVVVRDEVQSSWRFDSSEV
jgi:predicted nuclease of predicted toxin-antitoxin system